MPGHTHKPRRFHQEHSYRDGIAAEDQDTPIPPKVASPSCSTCLAVPCTHGPCKSQVSAGVGGGGTRRQAHPPLSHPGHRAARQSPAAVPPDSEMGSISAHPLVFYFLGTEHVGHGPGHHRPPPSDTKQIVTEPNVVTHNSQGESTFNVLQMLLSHPVGMVCQ